MVRTQDMTPGARPGRPSGTAIAVAALVVLAILIAWGHWRGEREAARERAAAASGAAPSQVRIADGETVVEMAADAQARGGIVVAAAQASAGGGVIGYGRVIPLDTIAALHNRYVAARSAVAEASARADASRREYERLALLHADQQNVSAKAVDDARAAMLADSAVLASASAPSRTLAAMARQDWGAVVGNWITGGSPEFDRLMSGSDVLVQVTVPFGSTVASAIAGAATSEGADTGRTALARRASPPHETGAMTPARTTRIETGPGAAVDARYVSTAARTDPAIQGPSFYYIARASPTLIPGMNVTAVLSSGTSAAAGAAIPDSAIVWSDGAPWVYVRLDSVTFARRRIAVGVPAAGGGSFVTTIAPGTPIVVHGAQVLLSEELRSRVPQSDEDDP